MLFLGIRAKFWELALLNLRDPLALIDQTLLPGVIRLLVLLLILSGVPLINGGPPPINHLSPTTSMMMIDYPSGLFWRFFWIFSSPVKVVSKLFIWRFWVLFLKRIPSRPSRFVDLYPIPIKLGPENIQLISSKMINPDLWLDHCVGPTHRFCPKNKGRLALYLACFMFLY